MVDLCADVVLPDVAEDSRDCDVPCKTDDRKLAGSVRAATLEEVLVATEAVAENKFPVSVDVAESKFSVSVDVC